MIYSKRVSVIQTQLCDPIWQNLALCGDATIMSGTCSCAKFVPHVHSKNLACRMRVLTFSATLWLLRSEYLLDMTVESSDIGDGVCEKYERKNFISKLARYSRLSAFRTVKYATFYWKITVKSWKNYNINI